MSWYLQTITPPDNSCYEQAMVYQQQLTKPPGSLGRLETLAATLAAMQGVNTPKIQQPAICVFAGDHGVVEEGVSAFPQVVTTEMVKNFSRGGAAISVLAQLHNAVFEVVDLGTVVNPGDLPNVFSARIGPSTANFTQQAAMTSEQLEQALLEGAKAAERAVAKGADLIVGGEMGIGNTTAASAILAALMKVPAVDITGPGTGIKPEQIEHKCKVIERALVFHQGHLEQPREVLQRLGGFEIAGLVGAYLKAALLGVPVLVDGFITTAAALVACRMNPECRSWMLFSHASAEPGHRKVLAELEAKPLIDLDLRLGEASGAAITIPLLQQACALHNGMATFTQAEVTDKA